MQRSALVEALTVPIRDDLIARGIDPRRKIAVCSGILFTDMSLCQPALVRQNEVVFAGRFVEVKNPLLLARRTSGCGAALSRRACLVPR